MWPVVISICVVLIGYYYFYKPYQHWKNLNVPHVKPVPIFGNTSFFLTKVDTVQNSLQKIYNATTGRVIGLYNFSIPALMIRDLDLIKQIGIKDFDHFVDHRTFFDENVDPLFGKGLFSLKGQRWRDMRATLSPAFTSSKMKAMFLFISDCAKQMVNHYETIAQSNKLQELELKDTFSRFANDVIASTAFGIQVDSFKNEDNEFYLMGKDATNFTNGIRGYKILGYNLCKPLMVFFRIKLFSKNVRDFFTNIIKTNILSREKEGIVRPDMIHLLMEARKGKLKHETQKDEDAGYATVQESDIGKDILMTKRELTDDDITAQALLFFIAGFDTISTAMCHFCYEVAQHPDIQQRLQTEIDEALEECKGKITYDIVMKLKYLDMVLTETLRKWPALVVFTRECVKPYIIKAKNPEEQDIPLKKGDLIWLPCYPIQRDPKYYPDPDKFDPERFSDDNKGNVDPISYMPFGIGPRNCIGSRFALMEAKLMMVHLFSKFSIVLTEKSDVPLKIKKGQFNPNAENGFWVGLQQRTN